jgi:hypothetical protein
MIIGTKAQFGETHYRECELCFGTICASCSDNDNQDGTAICSDCYQGVALKRQGVSLKTN